MPENTDYFVPLSCIKAPMSAYGYPKDVHKVDIETEKYFLDGEHYI